MNKFAMAVRLHRPRTNTMLWVNIPVEYPDMEGWHEHGEDLIIDFLAHEKNFDIGGEWELISMEQKNFDFNMELD